MNNGETEFHLILCLGVRVLEEAKAWRLRKELQPKKGEFKDINPRTFTELATVKFDSNYCKQKLQRSHQLPPIEKTQVTHKKDW